MAKAEVLSWGTTQEAADIEGVSTKTIIRWIAEGRIEGKRVGPRLVRVNLASLSNLSTPISPAVTHD